MAVRNSLPTRRVVTVSPTYELDDGEHGASLNDEAKRKIRGKSVVPIKVDAGVPHRVGGSALIEGRPPIKECRPMIGKVQGS